MIKITNEHKDFREFFEGELEYNEIYGDGSPITLRLKFTQTASDVQVEKDKITITAFGSMEMDGFVEFCREVVEKYDHYKQIRANLS